MRDLNFYDGPVTGSGLFGRLSAGPRRLLRKLLLPVFQRQAAILSDLCHRLDEHDARLAEAAGLRTTIGAVNAKADGVNAKADGVNAKADGINEKVDRLNDKLDRLNAKFEGVLLHFEELKARQDALAVDVAAVVALNWDHVAVTRRLAQLEDRLVGLGLPPTAPGDPADCPSVPFPGLERYEPGRAPAVEGAPERRQSQAG